MIPRQTRRPSGFGLGFMAAALVLPYLAAAADVPKQLKLPIGGPGAATNLLAKPDCDPTKPGRAIAYLGWRPAVKSGSEQRVVVTIVRDGFERGTFDVSTPLPSNATNLVWDRLKGQAIHHWRVLTLQPDGWTSSETARFRGPTCVNDVITPNPNQSTDPSKKKEKEGKP